MRTDGLKSNVGKCRTDGDGRVGWTDTSVGARVEKTAAVTRRDSSVSGMDERWLWDMQALKEVEAAREAMERQR